MPLAIFIWAARLSYATTAHVLYFAALLLIVLLVIWRHLRCPAPSSLPPGQPPGLIRARQRLLLARPPSGLLLCLAIAETIVALPLLFNDLLWVVLDAGPPGWVEKVPGDYALPDDWFDRTVAFRLADAAGAAATIALGVALVMLLRFLAKQRLTPSPGRPTALLVTTAVLLVLSLCGGCLDIGFPDLWPPGRFAWELLYSSIVLLESLLPAFLLADGIAALIDFLRGSRPTPDPSPVLPAPDDQPAPPAS